MKYITLILILICSNAMAGGTHYEPPKPEAVSSSNSESTSHANAAAIAGAAAQSGSVANAKSGDVTSVIKTSNNNTNLLDNVGNNHMDNSQLVELGDVNIAGDTYRAGDVSTATKLNNLINMNETRQFVAFQPGIAQHSIGETTVSVGTCGGNIGAVHDKGLGNGYGATAGCMWVPGQGDALEKAQRMQDFKLHAMKIDLLHSQESHQAEMMATCLQVLHVLGTIEQDKSPELWERCSGFEHHHPTTSGPVGKHNGYGDPRQVSPHNH
jgi:hypothetical protein